MTTKFEAPAMDELAWVKTEETYVGSGNPTPTPVPEPTPDGDWTITAEWRNHNSGSHSELAIKGLHHGNHTGNTLTMYMAVRGFKLEKVKDCGGMQVSNVSESGFTITRNNFYNPTDNFEFNIQITASDSKYHGAIGVTGSPCAESVVCVRYEEG